MNTLYSEMSPEQIIAQFTQPWGWEDEIALNLNDLERCQEISAESEGVFTVYTPERTAERIGEMAAIHSIRIRQSPTVIIDDLETTSRYHLALVGGGVPYASALGFEIHRQDPKIPYRQGYSKMGRYGNKQTGSEKLDVVQPPIAKEIDGMDLTIIDDLIDRGKTLMLAGVEMVVNGIPYSEITTFISKAVGDNRLSKRQAADLYRFYQSLYSVDPDHRIARPRSLAASVLVDKQFETDFGDQFELVDTGLYAPKVWLKRMGMDGLNEDGRWGEGIVASGVQEVKYANEMSEAIDLVGPLAIRSMDGKNPIIWLDENRKPTKLKRTYL